MADFIFSKVRVHQFMSLHLHKERVREDFFLAMVSSLASNCLKNSHLRGRLRSKLDCKRDDFKSEP